jgi:3-carboxy-cis,cis-muconate cycloisomerase
MSFSALDSDLVGPLLVAEGMRDVFSDRTRIAAMLRAETALARAEAAHGLVSPDLPLALAAMDPASLDVAAIGRATALAGVPTIPFVKAVQKRLDPALERDFHKGATTQDILDTALVLQVRAAFELLEADLEPTVAGLLRLAEAHRATPCVGRTYGQHAAPITFGFKAAGWALGIAEAGAALRDARARVCVASLGGPVGTLAALGPQGPAVADAFAHDLELAPAPMAWHALRGRIAETGAALGVLVGALAKLATDTAHLASTEVGEASEPYVPGRGGSSAMPHKRNPVSATVILAAHAAAKGLCVTLLDAMAAAHERSAGLWHAEWHALPALFGLASGALAEARRLAEGLEVNPERMRANLEATRGLLFADAASGQLARALGRERAHAIVERAAGRVRVTGTPLREVLAADPDVAGALEPAALDAAFDIAPAAEAAALWTDRGIAAVRALYPTL